MGLTNGTVLLSYDINKLHTEVKDEMISLGYSIHWRYDTGPTYQLPNTTLWHKNKSTNQAIIDIQHVCNRFGVTLEKAVAMF